MKQIILMMLITTSITMTSFSQKGNSDNNHGYNVTSKTATSTGASFSNPTKAASSSSSSNYGYNATSKSSTSSGSNSSNTRTSNPGLYETKTSSVKTSKSPKFIDAWRVKSRE